MNISFTSIQYNIEKFQTPNNPIESHMFAQEKYTINQEKKIEEQ